MSLVELFLDFMQRGGPVMWVIFITAWIAIIMLCERALRIQYWLSHANSDLAALQISSGTLNTTDSKSPLACILRQTPRYREMDLATLTERVNNGLSDLIPRLEGTLPTIAVLGSLLPMLGLLGTVTGMIEVFEVIALQGTGNPQEMAGGISQALLTTASGLIIAIPVIFAHHLLAKRLRHLLAVTEKSLQIIFHQVTPVNATHE